MLTFIKWWERDLSFSNGQIGIHQRKRIALVLFGFEEKIIKLIRLLKRANGPVRANGPLRAGLKPTAYFRFKTESSAKLHLYLGST